MFLAVFRKFKKFQTERLIYSFRRLKTKCLI